MPGDRYIVIKHSLRKNFIELHIKTSIFRAALEMQIYFGREKQSKHIKRSFSSNADPNIFILISAESFK